MTSSSSSSLSCEESECYISPSLLSSTMTVISSRKQLKKKTKRTNRYIDSTKNVRKVVII